MTLFTRIIILAIAATSLNLILGYGGMVSFGHAVYLGVGGYADRHPGARGRQLRLRAVAGRARGVRAVRADRRARSRLRTRGVYFIMITLAFAQLVYYFGVGLERYGGDDGLTIYRRSQFARPRSISPTRPQFYYLLPRAAAC